MDDLRPERYVHVAPLGAERDRIALPAIEYGADLVVLLDYLSRTPGLRTLHQGVTDDLDEAGVDYETRTVDVSDLYDRIQAVSSVVTEFADDRVLVNVSSGDTIMAVAAAIACMTDDAATPYYVDPESGGSVRLGGGPGQGMRAFETIPTYPVDRPTDEQLALMAHIEASDRTVRVDDDTCEDEFVPCRRKMGGPSSLLAYGTDQDLPFIAGYEGDEKGEARKLESAVLDPLADAGLIGVRVRSESRDVYLTDDGRDRLRAFRHLVD